jgi:hypothetical protein
MWSHPLWCLDHQKQTPSLYLAFSSIRFHDHLIFIFFNLNLIIYFFLISLKLQSTRAIRSIWLFLDLDNERDDFLNFITYCNTLNLFKVFFLTFHNQTNICFVIFKATIYWLNFCWLFIEVFYVHESQYAWVKRVYIGCILKNSGVLH